MALFVPRVQLVRGGGDSHYGPLHREPGKLVVSWSFERPAIRTRTRKNKMKWPTTRPPHLMLRVLMRGSDHHPLLSREGREVRLLDGIVPFHALPRDATIAWKYWMQLLHYRYAGQALQTDPQKPPDFWTSISCVKARIALLHV